jgi:two-component system C4-dicarboxylate transport response regulator DctD
MMVRERSARARRIKQQGHQGVVVLLEPDESVRDALAILLRGESWDVRALDACDELGEVLSEQRVVAVVSESTLPDCTPERILSQCNENRVPVIFTGHNLSLQGAVDLIRQGASDFLDKPFPQGRLVDLLKEIAARHNT